MHDVEQVAWNDADSERQTHQGESGRLWGWLFVATYTARANAKAGSELLSELYRVRGDGQSTAPELTTLRLVLGSGDGASPSPTRACRCCSP